MTTRPSRSASIPIPPGQHNIQDVFGMPFSRQAQGSTTTISPRTRRTSNVAHSPDDRRPRGPSTSPVRSTVSTSPSTRPIIGSYSAAASVLGRPLPAQRSGSIPVTPTNIGPGAPTFQPRIIRATSASSASHDPACIPVAPAPAAPTSPVRVRRLSSNSRTTSTPSAPRLSASLPAGAHFAPPLMHSHSASSAYPSTNAHLNPMYGQTNTFSRPVYLDYSALRDFLQTSPPESVPSGKYAIAASQPHPVVPVPTFSPVPYPYLRRSLTPVLDSESEGTASPSPPPVRSGETGRLAGVSAGASDIPLLLPTRWSDQDRNPALSVSSDGRELTFCGASCTGDKDSAAARANHPIPPACGIYYYEVEIIQRGAKGHISIGFSGGNVRLSRLPGLEPQSWGYHADDGWSFQGQKDGQPYGPTFDSGDVIGCGIDFSQGRAFYTKNGLLLKTVFENIPTSTVPLFPSVGLRHTHESVRANFGSAPFRYAIADHMRERRDAVWATITRGEGTNTDADSSGISRSGSVEPSVEANAYLRELVLAYLEHHGYARTAKVLKNVCVKDESLGPMNAPIKREEFDVPMETDEGPRASSSRVNLSAASSLAYTVDESVASTSTISETIEVCDPESEDLQTRVSIVNAVRTGDIDAALNGLNTHYPQALSAQNGLLVFRLRCRKFVELVLEALRRTKEADVEKAEMAAKDVIPTEFGEVPGADADGEGAMDVDDPSPEALSTSAEKDRLVSGSMITSPATVPSASDLAKSALTTALAYGQVLEGEYKSDMRPAVRAHLRRTFGIVAYADPEHEGGEIGAVASPEARVELAGKVNQAILESQGRPVHPALETLFRQAGACVTQLGLLGVGAAAFADVRQEFLDS